MKVDGNIHVDKKIKEFIDVIVEPYKHP